MKRKRNKFTGVHWDSQRKEWRGRIQYKNKSYNTLRSASQLEVARALDKIRVRLGLDPQLKGRKQ